MKKNTKPTIEEIRAAKETVAKIAKRCSVTYASFADFEYEVKHTESLATLPAYLLKTLINQNSSIIN